MSSAETKTVDYTPELFAAVMESQAEYLQTGWTVCGAEDPAVISLGEDFARQYPSYAGFTVCRVLDRYVSPWKSDTLMEFSSREATPEEYAQAEESEED